MHEIAVDWAGWRSGLWRFSEREAGGGADDVASGAARRGGTPRWIALSGWNAGRIEVGRLQSVACWVFSDVGHPDRTEASSHHERHLGRL
jgi:hypothetical protein